MRAGRTLRGAWSRRDLNVGLGLVVAVATAAAVAAPTFAGSAVADLVRERLASADSAKTDLTWVVSVPDPADDLPAVVDYATGITADSDGRFDRPAVSANAMVRWPDVDPDRPLALAWRADLCDQVAVTGRCPKRPGEVLLAEKSAASGHRIGDEISVAQTPDDDPAAGRTIRLTVVGTWTPRGTTAQRDTSRWTAGGIVPSLDSCDGAAGSELTTPRVGPLLTDLATLRKLPDVTVLADAALTPSADVERVRAADAYANQWQDGQPRPLGADSCAVAVSDTDIDAVVGPIDSERSRLQRQGIGAAAGAVLVGMLAVVLISTVASRRRRGELALVKLRGVRGARLVREALLEPLVPLVVGAIVGVPLGWAVAAVAGRVWLGGDVATALPSSVWPLVGLVLALAVLGVLTGLRRALREPVHLQLRPARPQPPSAGALLGRVMAFVVALVGVYQLSRVDDDPPWWALAMPVVMGFVAGLVAVWLIRRCAALLTAWSRRWTGNGAFLGARRLRRSGDLLAFVPFALAAIVLVVVAGGAWNVGSEWRASTALLRTGGPVAIDSGKAAGPTLAATRRADPGGQWLMTALSFDDNSRSYRRLYMDTSRWERVLAPDLAATPSGGASDIAPPVLDDLRADLGADRSLIRGTRVTMAATTDSSWYRHREPVDLTLVLRTDDGSQVTATLPLESRDRTRATVPVPRCRAGCRPQQLYVDVRSDPGNWVQGTVTIGELRMGGTDLQRLDWRLDSAGPHVRRIDDWRLRSRGGSVGWRLSGQQRPRLPVVTVGDLDLASADNPAEPGNTFGADGQPVPAKVVGAVDALPLIGDEGVFGDLSMFLADPAAIPSTAEVLVLARADTPDSVRAELRAAGVETGAVRQATQTRQLLDRDPYAQGLRFFWLVAALVAVIGACAVGVSLLSQRGSRGHETAALRVVGVGRRQLRLAVGLEVGLMAGLVALCGWLGAWISSRAILNALPVGQPGAYEPGPQTSTDLLDGVPVVAGAAGLLAAAALSVLLPMSVRSRPARLRSEGG